ncbi:ABC transporter permease subunit [Kluyvera intermedia]|uniref:ABC transporter permease subunit n=1 Tax=Kluyvera intermedia TaxID=61648 RepID=UPI0007881977|nr:ABC transporter permease subunit [Kluyvera intermedia]WQD28037.1 ABC transporter permease subunit [Kluyvera intermedia]VDZ83578.1 Inner membrane ABC transporter permease protein ynjC [Kluyvera intermedia]
MAAPLRYALITLCWGMMLIIYLPLLPAAGILLTPAFSLFHWQQLLGDPQLAQALIATLISTIIAVSGALLLTLLVIATLWPSPGWQRLASRLPWLLALPHVAFATCALLLFAEGGELYRLLPILSPVQDSYGIGLGLVLAIKESGFLMWVCWAILGERQLAEQTVVFKSLGFGRGQCLKHVILPALMPSLSIALLATTAWTLSVVDVAIIIGPGNPPTLAVLAWQWLNSGSPDDQTKGALACLLLLAILAALAGIARKLWCGWRAHSAHPDGCRKPDFPTVPGKCVALMLPLSGLICTAFLAYLAHVSLPATNTVNHSLWLALLSAGLGAAVCLMWLEWGPVTHQRWVDFPLLLPALPLAAGQYQLALYGWFDGLFSTVLWGHLLWVVPWMLFVLRPAWRRIDSRQVVLAQTLGWTRGRIFLRLKCPLIIRPLLSALAVGFSVSIAQYLPTQWLGGGRVPTLTTEAVALSSGGATATLAAQALWQLILPMTFFLLTALIARWIGHLRRGLR